MSDVLPTSHVQVDVRPDEAGTRADEAVTLTVVMHEAAKVLVLGGLGRDEEGNFDYAHNSSEILHPRKLTLTPGPTLGTGRSYAAVARVGKRRALVIGGVGPNYVTLNTSETVDLRSHTCVAGPKLSLGPRCGAAAVPLPSST